MGPYGPPTGPNMGRTWALHGSHIELHMEPIWGLVSGPCGIWGLHGPHVELDMGPMWAPCGPQMGSIFFTFIPVPVWFRFVGYTMLFLQLYPSASLVPLCVGCAMLFLQFYPSASVVPPCWLYNVVSPVLSQCCFFNDVSSALFLQCCFFSVVSSVLSQRQFGSTLLVMQCCFLNPTPAQV